MNYSLLLYHNREKDKFYILLMRWVYSVSIDEVSWQTLVLGRLKITLRQGKLMGWGLKQLKDCGFKLRGETVQVLLTSWDGSKSRPVVLAIEVVSGVSLRSVGLRVSANNIGGCGCKLHVSMVGHFCAFLLRQFFLCASECECWYQTGIETLDVYGITVNLERPCKMFTFQ